MPIKSDESVNLPNSGQATKLMLQAARGELLDAFADVEGAIAEIEVKLNLKPNNASLGQKIGRLKKLITAGDSIELSSILDQLTAFNEVRTEIVHRQMIVIPLKGGPRAVFVERSAQNLLPPLARIVSLDQFKQMALELSKLARFLREFTD